MQTYCMTIDCLFFAFAPLSPTTNYCQVCEPKRSDTPPSHIGYGGHHTYTPYLSTQILNASVC